MGTSSPEQGPPWRFIDSGPGGASFNMALDEALLRSVASGGSPPTLRVYRWERPSVSLGYAQKAERELDLERCARDGIEVVRRMTGGRAVWHEDELTYSFCGPADSDILGRTIAESWLVIARGILQALEVIGVTASLVPAGGKTPVAARTANPCFSSASRYEIAFRGRKLVGSAQRRFGGAFIQQGSFLLSNCQARLIDYQPRATEGPERGRLVGVLDRSVVGLDLAAGRRVGYAEAAEAFRVGFARAFGVELIPCPPAKGELETAGELACKRYVNIGGGASGLVHGSLYPE